MRYRMDCPNIRLERQGFALPTVMIASVVMLMVLLSGLVSSSSVNVILKDQYYDRALTDTIGAAEAHYKACLDRYAYSTTVWSDSAKLMPNTNCSGGIMTTCATPSSTTNTPVTAGCGLIENANIRTWYTVSGITGTGAEKKLVITAYLYLFRSGPPRTLASTMTETRQQSMIFKNNPQASIPAKRYWFFGSKAGIDFGSNGSTATQMTAPCSGSCVAGEGSTAIATRSGQIQFWTNGITVWDRNGTPMTNGNGSLNANASSTQAAAVFPASNNESKYVIITNTAEHAVTNAGELYYSIIDMSARGGLGDVVAAQRNVRLWTNPSNVNDYSSEASAAAPKADGSGYWVVTFSPLTTDMRVFSFNNTGTLLSAQPTTYSYGSPVSQYSVSAGGSGFGTLNFNADYSKLVMMAGNHCKGSAGCPYVNGLIRVMGFDTLTGAVTNQYSWDSYNTVGNSGYSADFSPSSNYVYASTLYPAKLVRYNISGATNDAMIKSSESPAVDTQPPGRTAGCWGGGQVLRGPDGKMYVANCDSSSVSVVNTPDASGSTLSSAGWSYDSFSLGANQSRYGLPQTVTIYTPTYLRY